MSREVIIDPVTRLEGHAKITIRIDENDQVTDAHFHVTEFRGFEKFCEGRPLSEMPSLTGRICGICPVSHLMASAKAGDAILAVRIPPTAEKLRRMMNLGQMMQSHALSFYYLSGPDLLLGMESDPAARNVFGLIKANPDLARRGIRVRQFGQEVIEHLGAKRIHPAWAVPGGVRSGLSEESRQALLARVPETIETLKQSLDLFKSKLDSFKEEIETFGNFPTMSMSLVADDGAWEHYGGTLTFVDSEGKVVAEKIDPANYRDYIGEAIENYSFLKFPYYKAQGYPGGIYRVGPLARLNICKYIGTPIANAEFQEYRQRYGTASSSFLFHYARLIEMIAATETVEDLLEDPEITSDHLRATAGINQLHGVGCSEAPRGTLFHDYEVDKDGLVRKVNLLIATGQNNLAMNKTVAQVAKHYIKGPEISEGALNRVEAAVRSFDPCLSCSTHAFGAMPMHVQMVRPNGEIAFETKRG